MITDTFTDAINQLAELRCLSIEDILKLNEKRDAKYNSITLRMYIEGAKKPSLRAFEYIASLMDFQVNLAIKDLQENSELIEKPGKYLEELKTEKEDENFSAGKENDE